MSDDVSYNKPMAGIVEESLQQRMIKQIHESRKFWYVMKYHSIQDAPGGSRYEARVADGNQEKADEMHKMSSERFNSYCKECMMNSDGTSMDADIPVTIMQLQALKNVRTQAVHFVNRHMQQLYRMLLSMETVPEALLKFFFEGMAHRYDVEVYEQAHLIMDNLGVRVPNSYDFKVEMDKLAAIHAGRYILTSDDMTRRQEANRCIEAIGKDTNAIISKWLNDAINKLEATDKKPVLTADAPSGPVLH